MACPQDLKTSPASGGIFNMKWRGGEGEVLANEIESFNLTAFPCFPLFTSLKMLSHKRTFSYSLKSIPFIAKIR
jgi:hypothetical protein